MNYQKVRLIAKTEPLDLGQSTEDLIAYCARVSNPTNQENFNTAPKLLRYLINHKHWSPFEMAHLVYEIETTRDISRQILRHRSFSFQEFSGRYAEMPDAPAVRELRLQDNKNRQNSIENHNTEFQELFEQSQAIVWEAAIKLYQTNLETGAAKEVARALLPEGLVMTRMYMAGSLRSWIHYVDVRDSLDTQKEHRDIAHKIKLSLMDNFWFLREYWYNG